MKTICKYTIMLLAALLIGLTVKAETDAPIKYEMRSAWVATVWRLDWPNLVIKKTGDETLIQKQKDALNRMLDSLAANNMNAINFQIRGRCDAMYKSSYEPWSSDLVESRGMDPGWDPLEYCVQACHDRGMECHAWLNPYRYESVKGQWAGTPGEYRVEHPDWVMDVESASILNPGKPEVIQRICDIIKEVITNYDVDGVLFDDYFYLSGTPASADADLYNAYRQAGGELSQNDWRRDNVNRMVEAVYRTIKEAKPWVRFGISPAGIACTSSAVARQYGVNPCPTGSDWQYASIYSDPLAWISSQNLDFISPQIYWTIGNGTDYDKACAWWSKIANKWHRHLYVSHSISSLSLSSRAPEKSGQEMNAELPVLGASGPNSGTYAEYANEIRLNRQYSLDDAPGSIFYSVKYMYNESPRFGHYLRNSVFGNKALVPPMIWFNGENPGKVTELSRAGATLSWKGYDNVRYTVYAFPETLPVENFDNDPQYLLGVSYKTEFTIPDNLLSGYNYAVSVLDRYGNEYSPMMPGVAEKNLAAPEVVTPKNGETIDAPFYFEWKAVEGATSYIVEVAEDAEFTSRLCTRSLKGTTLLNEELDGVPMNKLIYWRVRACGPNANDGITENLMCIINCLEINAPAHGENNVDLAPNFVWSNENVEGQLEISTRDSFEAAYIVYSGTGIGSHQVPKYILAAETHYFARVCYVHNGFDRITRIIEFDTQAAPAIVAPGIAYPTEGGVLHADESIALSPVEGAQSVRLEVASSTAFVSRSSYVVSNINTHTWADEKTGAEIKLNSKYLVDGETYYVRAQATYRVGEGTQKSDYCQYVTFTYSADPAGVSDVNTDDSALKVIVDGNVLSINCAAQVYDSLGRLVASLPAAATVTLPRGIYLVRAADEVVKVVL